MRRMLWLLGSLLVLACGPVSRTAAIIPSPTPPRIPTHVAVTATPAPTAAVMTIAPVPPTLAVESANAPTLADFWAGRADWRLDVMDAGLPIGESDTIYAGDGEFWSYLHASYGTAGIVDSCGDPVNFPGCVTRWVSVDGGQHFELASRSCVFDCNACPCDEDDHPWQQQYPRVMGAPDGPYFMVYEQGASPWISSSADGVNWDRAELIRGTGIWSLAQEPCDDLWLIGPHPFFKHELDCMVGGPPGLFVDGEAVTVFAGMGQNPAHLGCLSASRADMAFHFCDSNPLLEGAAVYGPLDARGEAANPYFDFRFVTSADVVQVEGIYYMAYEGIRGPSSRSSDRDNQFGLGFARSSVLDGRWEKYSGNPVLGDVADNWGVGHADLLIADGVTYLYTATSIYSRGRYELVWRDP